MTHTSLTRKRNKPLGLIELIAIALGGMIGGGIFTVLGISVALIGPLTPLAIALGGVIAAFAAYSYIKLGVYYKDEGATYSFYKKVFPQEPFRAALIGWWVIFGYISTLALYAFTFSSYALSGTEYAHNEDVRRLVAGGILLIFTLINIWSVKGMGKVEDLMVYTKLFVLVAISLALAQNSKVSLTDLLVQEENRFQLLPILIVSSLTFVAYEGFQLVINAVNEMNHPEKNIPRAIYSAIFLATSIYVIIALGAILAIPFEDIIRSKEFALAAGAHNILGKSGYFLVILGALLATSSAISGTVFGASRQMAVIAQDGFFPKILTKRYKGSIPSVAIITMSSLAFTLILSGGLELILEFGSITFLLVSLLMAFANHKVRKQTQSHPLITSFAIFSLSMGTFFILFYELKNKPKQLIFVGTIYALLTIGAWLFALKKKQEMAIREPFAKQID
ncbi:MAG: APC family permease [Bdellovibrio sp.]|nr:MAG: APC family permease [Bdellovibrio sp.]